MATEGQFDKKASDMEEQMKKRCIIECYAEEMALFDIYWNLLNA